MDTEMSLPRPDASSEYVDAGREAFHPAMVFGRASVPDQGLL